MRKTMQPEPGKWATRTISRFILLPKTLPRKDGVPERRWLERAWIYQRFEPYNHRIGAPCFWEDIEWAEENNAKTH